MRKRKSNDGFKPLKDVKNAGHIGEKRLRTFIALKVNFFNALTCKSF